MSGGTPANTTSKTTTELPAWAQKSAENLLYRGSALSQQEMPVYDGQRSAGLNNFQKMGMGMATDRALSGSGEINAGSQALQSTLGGQYLGHTAGANDYMGDNPYLQQSIDKAAGDITRNYSGAVNATDATMARAGAFGGSAWQQAQEGNSRNLAQSLSDSATSMRMQNYNQSAGLAESALGRNEASYQAERQRQLGAMPLALQYGNQAYTDAAQLQGVGELQYGADQQQLTDQMAYFNEKAQSPYKQLDVLGNTIRAAVGGGSTVSESAPGANQLGQAVGGAAALYGMLGK
jgi:hypothetical protein